MDRPARRLDTSGAGVGLSPLLARLPRSRQKTAGVDIVVIAGATYTGISTGDALRGLAALADGGQYSVTVSKTFPLAQASQAQEFGRTGQTIGKIVLVIDPSRSKLR